MPAGDGSQTINRLSDANGEFLMIWGKQDPHVPLEGRKLLYNSLTEAEVNFSWHEFNAQHAFIRDEGDRYDPEIATTCYKLTLDLFHRALR